MAELPTGTIADLVMKAAATVPRHLALVDAPSGASLTWRALDAAVDAYARVLTEHGLTQGDRVVLLLPNGLEFCVALFGVIRAGGVAVPIDTESAPPEVRRVVEHCGAELALGLGGDAAAAALPAPVLDAEPGEPFAAVGGGEDLAVLCYTSGTGGLPRGVMLSHRALLANVEQCAALRPAPVTAQDRVLLALPLSHAYGLSGLWQVAAAGATGVLLDHFAVGSALAACQERRISTVVGVPAMYRAFVGAGAERLGEALSTVRLATSGAAPLDPGVLAGFRRETGLSIYEGYGLTETGPVLTSTLASGVAKPGSVGKPIPGVELRLVDSDGSTIEVPTEDDEISYGEEETGTGLVAARGPNLFSGYWPDGAHGPDADGWFRTGDVGYLDPDGDLRLVDRANDLIIVNGFNVYPHEVERVVGELPEVAEAAAVGVPDERAGERVKVVVVLRPGTELTEDGVRAHCAENLARFKVPAAVEFADALPHSVTGKIRRAGLRGPR
ncbi:AMP-binding protein [Actinokineospora spheciospongiae]|uniref:AMP-binding protein n=1 Tax=Actinokineospora spheciospongiae TaxID=909613 RepID=UPI000D7151C8|nr:AMP-binding protein [Actinokineospora spheciospongiae]PWW64168.1 long-chain acyl-CoA synthetase [Actinokineospora spheciospongiae]